MEHRSETFYLDLQEVSATHIDVEEVFTNYVTRISAVCILIARHLARNSRDSGMVMEVMRLHHHQGKHPVKPNHLPS
jgi:hypothetical protein